MERIRTYIKNMSFKRKIIYYAYLVILPILLVIGALLMYSKYGEVKRERVETNINHVHGLSDSVNLILTDVNDMSTYIAINQDIINILQSDDPEELNRDSRLWAHQAPIQMMQDMMALKGYIKSAAIYPENGVKPYLSCTDASSYVQNFETVRETALYQKAYDGRGKSVWSFIPKGSGDVYAANRTDKLVHARVVFDLTKTKPLGYLVFGIPAERLEKLSANIIQSEAEAVVIFTHEGEPLYGHHELPGKELEAIRTSGVLTDNYKKENGIIDLAGKNAYTYQEHKTAPIICKVVPGITVSEIFRQIIYMPLALIIGVLLGLFPVLIFVSNIVTKPLANVCRAMGQFRQGDFDQQLAVETGDEVGEVAACFNKMVTDIKELIDKNYVMALKEKESELTTLQAQINPHFLYNTLDVLYWQANDAGNEEIAENIYALSQLFRMVLGQGKGSITVAGEGELVSRYLEIQKMRFSRRMDYIVDIAADIQEQQIPKLILQPFVENAVVHGIGNSKEHCLITVTGRRKGERMEFVIRDTGAGMTPEQLAAIWKGTEDSRGSGHKIGGYAIYNVKERLELKYQGESELRIESEVGRGTDVVINIPMEGNS